MARSHRAGVRGALIGQCLGDALGFPVEGQSPAVCSRYVAEHLAAVPVTAIGRPPFAFGQYTDDSQLARELLRSLVAGRRFDPVDYATRIASLFADNHIVGRGRATEAAARRLIQGVPWDEAGTPAPAAGNGSAMRVMPVGLVYHRDPERLRAVAVDQGRITHRDVRCGAGAVAIAGAVAMALTMEDIVPVRFCVTLADWVAPVDAAFAESIQQLPSWTAMAPEAAFEFIRRAGYWPDQDDGWHGISPFVVPSVLWSLYAFLRSPDDYWTTIGTAIAVGGDVDTTAAMAGAISGARVGLEGLPAPLVSLLNDQGQWGYEALIALADAAVDLGLSAAP
jgi:ADP-ribosylglycohydrolase